MNKKLFLTLLLSLQVSIAFSCGCFLQAYYFCEDFGWEWLDPDEELVLIRALERGFLENGSFGNRDLPYLRATVVKSIYAESPPDTITLILDDGANCAGQGYYSYGDTVLVQVEKAYPVEDLVNPYYLAGCGAYSLAYQNDTLLGNIFFDTNKMALQDFEASVEVCKNTVPHLYLHGEVRSIKTEEALPEFTLQMNEGEITTDSGGAYSGARVPFLNPQSVDTLVIRKQGESFADISVADVLRIRLHILNKVPLEKIWEYLAADINGSKSITTLDVILLQRIILGIDNQLPGRKSWIIIPAVDYHPERNFHEAHDWNFPRERFFVFPIIGYTRMEYDLWAIKIGDLV